MHGNRTKRRSFLPIVNIVVPVKKKPVPGKKGRHMTRGVQIMLGIVVSVAIIGLSGCESSSSDSVDTSANSSTTASGFIWKPVSEGDGKLVILFPSSMRGDVTSGEIHRNLPPKDSTLLETGWFAGDTHNGDRPHYRFSMSGGSYGDNLFAVARRGSGGYDWWKIPNGSTRAEY